MVTEMDSKRDFYSQVHFTDESDCSKFIPNRFRSNICTACSKEIFKHTRDSVENKEILMKALEYTQSKEKVGTLIISGESNHHVGALYLGGYQSSINKEFLCDQHITHIFNTAAGLVNFFGPKYQSSVQAIVNDLNIEYLALAWDDAADFHIPMDDIIKGLTFIENGRKTGNVLVHCAQGKSRSSTIVVAYVMAFLSLPHDQALEFVQEKRKMAQPNPGFLTLLSNLNNAKEFVDFQRMIKGP